MDIQQVKAFARGFNIGKVKLGSIDTDEDGEVIYALSGEHEKCDDTIIRLYSEGYTQIIVGCSIVFTGYVEGLYHGNYNNGDYIPW
jgi:hypothetical protein